VPEARDIDPAEIRPNPNNPRLIFDPEELTQLRESIAEVHILVPLTVYETEDHEIRLIDGERRLRCALELGLPTVPCYVVDGVDETTELEWMFSTHVLREQWENGPIAKAIRGLVERLGGWDDERVQAVTGFKGQRLAYFRALAEAPEEILERIIDGELPPNLVADSLLRVGNPLRNELPDLAGDRSDEDYINAMVEKRDAGNLPDVVALRKLRTMISVAAENPEADGETAELKDAITRALDDPETSIEEVYEDTVETRVAAETFQRAADRFKKSSSHVVAQVLQDRGAIEELARALEDLADHLRCLAQRLREE